MADIGDILATIKDGSAAIAAASSTIESLRSLVGKADKIDGREARELLLEVYDSLISAKAGQIEAERLLAELRAEIAAADTFDEKVSDFELVDIRQGTSVYQLRETDQPPGHYGRSYCPNCFDARHLSILQTKAGSPMVRSCPRCKTDYVF